MMMIINMNIFVNWNNLSTFVVVELKRMIHLVDCMDEISNNDERSADFRGRVISCSTGGN